MARKKTEEEIEKQQPETAVTESEATEQPETAVTESEATEQPETAEKQPGKETDKKKSILRSCFM